MRACIYTHPNCVGMYIYSSIIDSIHLVHVGMYVYSSLWDSKSSVFTRAPAEAREPNLQQKNSLHITALSSQYDTLLYYNRENAPTSKHSLSHSLHIMTLSSCCDALFTLHHFRHAHTHTLSLSLSFLHAPTDEREQLRRDTLLHMMT